MNDSEGPLNFPTPTVGRHPREVLSDAARPLDLSVIVPCRQEARYIAPCLDSIVATEFPRERFEVLVVDGRSDDGSRQIIEEYAQRYPHIRLIDNPTRTIPAALNAGLRAARGAIIARMDAHATYPANYLPGLVKALQESIAENVGGQLVTVPTDDSPMARAIAIGLSHPFGVGNSHFRIGTAERRWVDTVPFGCYRREVFDRIGGFDEEMVRNEDEEFNTRLRKHGGRILLVPIVTCAYYGRCTLSQVGRMFYQYGYFKPLVARKTGGIATMRQLVPVAFVLVVAASALGSLFAQSAAALLAAVSCVYSTIVLSAVARTVPQQGLRCAFALAMVFPVLHVSYGVGFLAGLRAFVEGDDARAARCERDRALSR